MRRQPWLPGDSPGDGAGPGTCQPHRQALREGPRDQQHQVRQEMTGRDCSPGFSPSRGLVECQARNVIKKSLENFSLLEHHGQVAHQPPHRTDSLKKN